VTAWWWWGGGRSECVPFLQPGAMWVNAPPESARIAFAHHNINSSSSSPRTSPSPIPDFLPAKAKAAPQMAPRGSRVRGTANQAPAKRGGWRSARPRSSGPHNRESLIVTRPAHQLPTPENANPSLDTPASPQEPAEQVAGEGAEQLMAPVRDPNNVDGTPSLGEICRRIC
jgi:hypothetical protein